MGFIDAGALLLLVAANATPVLVAHLLGHRVATPIDAALRRTGGAAVFGAHKTWRGLVSGVAAGALVGALLPCGPVVGAGFALLALGGDLGSSFVKRRLGLRSGAPVLLLDQLPESLLPLLVFAQPLGLSVTAIVGTAACFTLLDLLTARWR